MNAENTHSTHGAFELPHYVDHLLSDAEALAAALAAGPLDAPIAGCPGWDLRHLGGHMGVIHRWATHCVTTGAPPAEGDISMPSDDLVGSALATWVSDGAASLADALRGIDPDAPTWHPFPIAKIAGVWPRRQAHETSMHRWDAQHAIGTAAPIDAEFASDGIDEFFSIALPRVIQRERIEPPTGSVHVHCTDVAGEWLVWNDDEGYHLVREHRKGDAALRGPAEQILLALVGRDGDRSDLSPVGDEATLQAWFDLPGL